MGSNLRKAYKKEWEAHFLQRIGPWLSSMKRKIVMKVHMNCQKCRTKALKVVAGTNEVSFVGLEGEDKVVVIGDRVDAVKLTNCLRKKVAQTDIISVAEV